MFANGFTDLCLPEYGSGVLLADRQLDANEGFEGELTLCLDVPDAVFERYEWFEEGGGPGYRLSLIPAGVVNSLGKPAVYDHDFAGCSRRQLLQTMRRAEGEHAARIRRAVAFLDEIGWLTPLKLRESAGL
jgi:hypothetical protein